jgi:hypothetical protein
MRGLPFPQDAAFERETSYEYGTPASNLDDIPIDPALADPLIDPALQPFPIKIDSDQVRTRFSSHYATRLARCGCGVHSLIDRVASRLHLLSIYPRDGLICMLMFFPSFRTMFLSLSLPMLPITSASTPRVLRVIHLHSLHLQTTIPLSVNPYSPQSHRKRRGRRAGNQTAASVAATTRRIRLASRRRWSPVTNVVAVVSFPRV